MAKKVKPSARKTKVRFFQSMQPGRNGNAIYLALYVQ